MSDDEKVVDRVYLASYIGVQSYSNVFSPYLQICSTTPDHLLHLQSILGGNIYRTKPRSEKHKPAFYLYWRGRACKGVLIEILPYIRLKQEQARLLLAYPAHPKGVRPTKEEKMLQAVIYLRLKKLNRKGPEDEEIGGEDA